jgi:glycosyltransferase involved in cell wall biosynthesis
VQQITHIITTLERGGAENQLVQVVAAQRDLGFSVQIVFLKGENQLNSDIKIAGGVVVESLANKSPWLQLFLLRRLIKNASVVHAHLPRAEILCGLLGPRNLVVTRHNAEKFFPRANSWLSILLSRFVTSRARAVIAISVAVKDFLYESKEVTSKTRIEVVYYGYRPSSHFNSTVQDLGETAIKKEFVVGTISRLTEQKDIPVLLNAFKVFLNQFPNSQLQIIGDGHLRRDLEALAVKLDISSSVIWIGRVMNIQIHLATWDMFVLTSKYEGFGLVLLEAADVNVPIVASRISAIPEVLGDSYPLLAASGDYLDFAQKMVLATDDSIARTCRSYNIQVIERFDVIKMATKLVELYGFKQPGASK